MKAHLSPTLNRSLRPDSGQTAQIASDQIQPSDLYASSAKLNPRAITQLQRTYGNQYVLRLLDKTHAAARNTRSPLLQRVIHYQAGKTKTPHPRLKTASDTTPHTMLVLGQAGTKLESDCFNSCVGVTFLDDTQKWGAIAHFWAGGGAGADDGAEVLAELAAVIQKIQDEGIAWNNATVNIALHIGASPEHKFSVKRASALRGILTNHGVVGAETSGLSVSIQVPN